MNDFRFPAENIAGQAELGYPHRHHAAQFRQGFEDGHFIAGFTQVVGGGQAGRSAADYRHPLFLFRGDGEIFRVFPVIVGRALQGVDGYRLLDIPPHALALAGAGADPADDAGEGQGLFNQGQRLVELALFDQGDIPAYIDMQRAGGLAGRRASRHAFPGIDNIRQGLLAGFALFPLVEDIAEPPRHD